MSYFPTFESTTQKPFLPHCLSLTWYMRCILYSTLYVALFVFVYRHAILVPNLSAGRIGKQFYPTQEKNNTLFGKMQKIWLDWEKLFSLNINETTISCAVYVS